MKHSTQLDGLRFIAVFFVLIAHFAAIIGDHISAGYYGVDLFFVISGFLITSILLKSEGVFISVYKKFIIRRILRIVPIYYILIAILFFCGYYEIQQYLKFLLSFTFNYAMVFYHLPLNALSHFWTLCVEMQFYFFWPIIILGFRKKTNVLKWVVLIFICLSYLQFYFKIIGPIGMYTWVGVLPQSYALGIGALGAIYLRNGKLPHEIFSNKWIEYFVIVALLIFLITDQSLKFIFCPLISLYFVIKAVYLDFSFKPLRFLLNNKHLIYLGSISYGIYLFHLPMYYYFTEHLFYPYFWNKIDFNSLGAFKKIERHSWIILFPLCSSLSILLSMISYNYIEHPILKYKDQHFK